MTWVWGREVPPVEATANDQVSHLIDFHAPPTALCGAGIEEDATVRPAPAARRCRTCLRIVIRSGVDGHGPMRVSGWLV